jgi:hypothetical protein
VGEGILAVGVELELLDPALDDVEFLAVLVEADHQLLELLAAEGLAQLRLLQVR